jgi:hypothetical protein
MGNTDLGCANSLANTLIYYAKAKGVEAKGEVKEGTKLEEKALYTAQQLMDRSWNNGRDNIGMTRIDHNGSLARIWEQKVYVPSGASGKYPYGYTVDSSATFFSIRPMYEKLEGYEDLHNAYLKDKDAGAEMVEVATAGTVCNNKYGANCATQCKNFDNLENVDLAYHRFWHAGDVMMAMGTMFELYPEVIPTGEESIVDDADWGNVDCSEGASPEDRVDVKDAVLLARIAANDTTLTTSDVSDAGKKNADVAYDGLVTKDDLIKLLTYLAKQIPYSDLGNQ